MPDLAKITALKCKACGAMMPMELPEPEKVVVKEPCKCGVTELARINRYWTTFLACAALFVATAIAGTSVMTSGTKIEELQKALEVKTLEVKQAEQKATEKVAEVEKQAASQKSEADKYKEIIDRLIMRNFPEVAPSEKK